VAVAVEIDERRAHAGADVLDARLHCHVAKAAPPARKRDVVVEVLTPEVVRDQEVGPAVVVVVAPGGGEAEAIVVLVEPRLCGHFHEAAVAVVAEQHVGRPVARVVIGSRRARLVLARADEVRVRAEVDVEEAVVVEVRDRYRGRHAAQRPACAEGARDLREVALAVV